MTEKTPQNCIDFVSNSDSDLVEHRMDFMHRITGLREIYSATDIPIIATCRSREMGGNFVDGESQRIDHLLEAINSGASIVDIEVETEKDYMKQIRNKALQNDCQLIISKHFKQVTPEYRNLLDLIDKMIESGADILKVVVTPESIRDCGRILQLYSLENLETPLIAFAMGNIGRFTRVSALFLGAPFMYVSQDSGEKAAPGQISMSEMRAILRSLS
ncbi:MAG: type I 3-dehydroquinate dehydratase [Candidatus Thorarchaeota archaeon]